MQPTTLILLDFLCRPCIPAPSPSAHWQTHILTCGVQGCCLDHPRRYHSVLSTTDWSFNPYQAPSNAPLLSQLISPPVRGFHGCGNSQPFRSPRASGSVPLHSLFFSLIFLSSYLATWGSFLFFPVFKSLCQFQLMLCENCSICRCILDTFVKRDVVYILLL